MKTLSIRQPWASLICTNLKTIENRSWETEFRGEVAIHAGSFRKGVDHYAGTDNSGLFRPEDFTFGAIIGTAELYDCICFDVSVRDDPWAEGPFCFRFRSGVLFKEPIPCSGRVRLTQLENDLVEKVNERKTELVELEEDGRLLKSLQQIPAEPIPKNLVR